MILTQTKRNPRDRSACRAEKRRRRTKMTPIRGLICPALGVCVTVDTGWDENRLFSRQNQAILPLSRRPLDVGRLESSCGIVV